MKMTCEQSRELFSEALYNELDVNTRRLLDEHLTSCTACRNEYKAMQETLSVMDKRTRIEPNEDEWGKYADRLARTIEQEKLSDSHPRIIRWQQARIPAWIYGIAAMLLITIGVYLGKTFFVDQHHDIQSQNRQIAKGTLSPSLESDSTAQEALAYLERSRNLLVGLTNLDEEHHASVDLTHHQEISRELIDQGIILTAALNQPSHQQLRQLIMDLQIILLQLANIEVRPGAPAVELVKQGVDSKSILLKINLEEIRAKLNEPQVDYLKKKERNNL